MALQKSILLLGFRAVGKTTIAPLLAARCGSSWVSVDALVEQRSGMSIASMVQQYGWQYFREQEAQMVQQLLKMPPQVIDVGAGIVEHAALLPQLEQRTWRVWLDLPLRELLHRYDPRNRPPLTSLPLEEEVKVLWQRRRPRYGRWANVRIACRGKAPEDIAAEICMLAQQEGILMP